MILFENAFKTFKYSYFHLISGTDLPVKNKDYIYNFFKGKDEIFITNRFNWSDIDYRRLSVFHCPKWFGEFLTNIINILQNRLKIDRIKKYKMQYCRGQQWGSLPYDAVGYLVKKRKFIKKICRFTSCADEVYKQFLLYNSPLKDKIFKDANGQTNDLREIDWIRRVNDSPHVFTIEDKEMLFNSKKLFARKFDEKVDKKIIDEVFEFIKSKGNI